MSYPIIMFVGHAGSGKDTAAAFAREFADTAHGGKPEAITLATPIKEFGAEVFGFTHEVLWGPSELRNTKSPWSIMAMEEAFYKEGKGSLWAEKYGLLDYVPELTKWFEGIIRQPNHTARHILQQLGTEFGRTVSPDVWIDIGIRQAEEKLTKGAGLVTVTDGRFRNEVLKVKRVGGKVVRLIDPNDETVYTHPSETEMDTIPAFWYDAIIYNSKTRYAGLTALKTSVQDVVLSLGGTVKR